VDWYLWGLLADSWRLGTTSIQVSRTPLWIPQAVMAVGGLLLIVELLLEMALVITAEEALPAGDSTVA
jgi:TRAP-type mannitol/chloroaromatic compound transport system permease small subunit